MVGVSNKATKQGGMSLKTNSRGSLEWEWLAIRDEYMVICQEPIRLFLDLSGDL